MIPIHFLSLLLLSPLTSGAALNGNPIHLPLIRRATRHHPLDLAKAADHLRAKYGYSPVSPTLQKRTTAGISIVNQVG